MATLKVTVHEARDLPVMDRATGLADPYVVLKLNDIEHSTDIVHRTRHPHWNADFRFETSDLLVLQEDPFELRVYDHDIISRDDIIGFVLLDCNSIVYREDPILAGWFPLYDTNAGVRGDIRLTIRIKFHAAENPLAPCLPERYIQRLQLKEFASTAAAAAERSATAVRGRDVAEDSSAGSSADDGGGARLYHRGAPTKRSTEKERRRGGIEASGEAHAHAAAPAPGVVASSSSNTFNNGSLRSPALRHVVAADPGVANASPSSLLPYLLEQDLDPIQAARFHHPTLSGEEEGVFVFSVWRLDPSVYRVESIATMVEELIVKADPEHSRLTNLRSTRSTNEARIIQLYKLSGKVRRQLARKVVELQCNAVLGYVEEFDLEPSGIIVRAYGTPCVISMVKYVDEDRVSSILRASSRYFGQQSPNSTRGVVPFAAQAANSGPEKDVGGAADVNGFASNDFLSPTGNTTGNSSPDLLPTGALTAGSATSALATLPPAMAKLASRAEAAASTDAATPRLAASSTAGPPASVNNSSNVMADAAGASDPSPILPQTSKPVRSPTLPTAAADVSATPALAAASSRATVVMLSVKDLPSGCVQHIGGYVCARSVKIVSKVRSKQMISQERDAWWMELREELKANARAFHCNAVVGYEEDAQYYEDVALLSLYGTAVMLDPSMIALRAGPEFLYHKACELLEEKRSCTLVHLYHGAHRKALGSEVGEFIHYSLCNICHRKPVPDVLLASCALPVDIRCDGPPQLVQVAVAKPKLGVKGVGLAMAVSQALPFIEFALHKQLLFHLRLMQLNACFGMQVHVAIGPDAIVGTLTGTGVRLAGLPVPSLPRVEVVDRNIQQRDVVLRLKGVVSRRLRWQRRRAADGSGSSTTSSSSSGSSRRSASSSASSSSSSSPSGGSGGSSSSSSGKSRSHSSSSRCNSWLPSSSGDDEEDVYYRRDELTSTGRTKVTDFIVKIDDEEEAELMLGMVDNTTMEDALLLTIPYVPDDANLYERQEHIVVHRRFGFPAASGGGSSGAAASPRLTTRVVNDCCTDAKRAFVQTASRAAFRHGTPARMRVVQFSMQLQFSPNSEEMHLRLEGCLLVCSAVGVARITQLEDRAFQECVRNTIGSVSGILAATGTSGSFASAAAKVAELCNAPDEREGSSLSDLSSLADLANVHSFYADPVAFTISISAMNSIDNVTATDGALLPRGMDTLNSVVEAARRTSAASVTSPNPQYVIDAVYCFYRQLFLVCNAPFSLPFVLNYDVPALRPPLSSWSTAADEDGAAHPSSTSPDYSTAASTASGGGRRARPNVVGRQWQALLYLAGTSFRNFVEKTFERGEGKSRDRRVPQGDGALAGGGGAGNGSNASQPHQPALRLPRNADALTELTPTVRLSPLDFVAGEAVVRYLGHLSQHYIRENHDVDTGEKLGAFFLRTETEVQCCVQALVRLMGGNALLKHRMVYHETLVGDGSGNAFVFLTVTGDVVQTTAATRISVDGTEVDAKAEKEPDVVKDPPLSV